MSDFYRVAFPKSRLTALAVEIPDGMDAVRLYEHLAHVIAKHLDLHRFEIQMCDVSGHIRSAGDDGPGVGFTITPEATP